MVITDSLDSATSDITLRKRLLPHPEIARRLAALGQLQAIDSFTVYFADLVEKASLMAEQEWTEAAAKGAYVSCESFIFVQCCFATPGPEWLSK
jgi:hypothetical protein